MFVIGDFLWSGLRKKIRDLVFINLLLCLLFFLHSKLNVTDLFRAVWLLFFFFFSCCGLVIVVVMGVVVANGGGDCGWLLKFVMDVFIIILMSYLYYFNQIAKNIDLLMLNVKR